MERKNVQKESKENLKVKQEITLHKLMTLETLLKENITIVQALEKISENTSPAYKWYPVRGKNGCLFELGGRKREGLELELKAYIPEFKEGNYVSYPSGMFNSDMWVDSLRIGFKEKTCTVPSGFDLISFLQEHDFRTYRSKIESKQVPVRWEWEYKWVR